jgi:hypothetical protein
MVCDMHAQMLATDARLFLLYRPETGHGGPARSVHDQATQPRDPQRSGTSSVLLMAGVHNG